MLRAIKMTQWVKVLVRQARRPEFNPRIYEKVEGENGLHKGVF